MAQVRGKLGNVREVTGLPRRPVDGAAEGPAKWLVVCPDAEGAALEHVAEMTHCQEHCQELPVKSGVFLLCSRQFF